MKGRFFAGFGAALFLVTSSALAIVVIISLAQQHSASNSSNTTATTPAVSANKVHTSATLADANSSANTDGKPLQGFTPTQTPYSQLSYADIAKGNGAVVKQGQTITATYAGALAKTGAVFDSTVNDGGKPITIKLATSSLIPGWVYGLSGMRVGGTRELFIPASLGYGSQGNSSIPANSDLVFYVTVQSAS